MYVIKRPALQCVGNLIRRTITKTVPFNNSNYDEEMRTTVHIMNKDEDMGLMIDGFSQVGFRLNNNMTVLGPMVIFPRTVLAWNIGSMNDVNEDTLSLFKVVEPKIDILVIGTGDKVESGFFKELFDFSRKYKISFEILPTEAACPTFNFLNAEGRNVAAALIPPETVKYTEDDEVVTKLRYQKLFQAE